MTCTTAERLPLLAALCRIAAVIAGTLLVLGSLIAAAILLYLFSLTAQISEGIERAVNSPEFQTQLAVIGVFYLIASWLVTAWSHFESLVHELNAMEQVSAASLKWLDDAIALFSA